LEGTKRFEFRRRGFADTPDHVAIYSTSPEQQIIGWFDVDHVIEDTPEALWSRCGHAGGIGYDEFMAYYEGRDTGYAIAIGEITTLDHPLRLDDLPEPVVAPQSYRRLDATLWDEIAARC
jgi:predicted transcriptional regulator